MSDIREFLIYCPLTGQFKWKIRSGKAVAGAIAGKTTARGYRMLLVKGKSYQAHRAAWFFMYGEWPIGQIDHINRCPTDNRIANLRVVTGSENCRNKHHKSTSGFRGVAYHKKTGKWQVQACLPLKPPKYLGLFAHIEDAAEVYRTFMNDRGLL